MGYRSTFVTDDTGMELPDWFGWKWGKHIHGAVSQTGKLLMPISSRYEAKTYGIWSGLESDLQKVLQEAGRNRDWHSIHIVFMGEDGNLFKSEIFSDRIEGSHITK